MKILFLDVDGVLNNAASIKRGRRVEGFEPESLFALRRVIEATGCKIVVSSTWRIIYSVPEFNEEVLKAAGLPPVAIGATPKEDARIGVAGLYRGVPRGDQILAWLREHPEVTEWAVVDDDSDMNGVPAARFVQTDWETGLRHHHADRLISILDPEHDTEFGARVSPSIWVPRCASLD